MFEVKHYGFDEKGQWVLLRARCREYPTLLDAYSQAQAWVDEEGGQAQLYEGERLINVCERRRRPASCRGRFWR
jgi:hypothetical protein